MRSPNQTRRARSGFLWSGAWLTFLALLLSCTREATPVERPPPPPPWMSASDEVSPAAANELHQVLAATEDTTASDDGPGPDADALDGEVQAEANETDENGERDYRVGGFILNSSVSRFERRPDTSGLTFRCQVSVAVREAESGNLRVMLQGWAESTGIPPTSERELEEIERDMVRSAADSALRRLRAVIAAPTGPSE